MDSHCYRISRNKNAVTLIKSNEAALVGNRPTAIHTQQHPECQFICTVMHCLTPLCVDQHPVDLEILAAGQQFRGYTLPIFQDPERLLRLCAAVEIGHIQCFVNVQFPLLSVFPTRS